MIGLAAFIAVAIVSSGALAVGLMIVQRLDHIATAIDILAWRLPSETPASPAPTSSLARGLGSSCSWSGAGHDI